MTLRKARLKMIRAFDGAWDAMAAALGMSRMSLENRIYERKNQRVWTETDLQMQAFSKTTHFAEEIAALSGGVFIKLPEVDQVRNESLLEKFNDLYSELGDLSKRFSEATKDGEVDEVERADLADIGAQIHRKTEELLQLTFRLYCRVPRGSRKGRD